MGRPTVFWDWGWTLSSTTFFMPSTPGRKHADTHRQTIYSAYTQHWELDLRWLKLLKTTSGDTIGGWVKWQQSKFQTCRFVTIDGTSTFNLSSIVFSSSPIRNAVVVIMAGFLIDKLGNRCKFTPVLCVCPEVWCFFNDTSAYHTTRMPFWPLCNLKKLQPNQQPLMLSQFCASPLCSWRLPVLLPVCSGLLAVCTGLPL